MYPFRKLALAGITLSIFFLTLISTGCGSSNSTVRIVDAYPNVTSVDMLINNKTIATGVAYGTGSGYASATSGSPNLLVNITGTNTNLINQTVTIGSGQSTILATGSGAIVFADDNSSPGSGNIKIRVINASPSLGATDVYVVTSGTSISGLSPTFASLNTQTASGYQALSAGSYQVVFTPPGQQSAEITTSALSFSAGQVRTIVVFDTPNGGFTTGVLSDSN